MEKHPQELRWEAQRLLFEAKRVTDEAQRILMRAGPWNSRPRRIFWKSSGQMTTSGASEAIDYEDPEFWLARAEKARVIAEGMKSPEARCSMFGMAEMYTRVAQRVRMLRDVGECP